eukprot:Sspe_Gene.112197::Locus_95163_Transcript_1_1_Confidence_1.000_Length_309::g.112197::m.112197
MQSALGFKVNLTVGDFEDHELIRAVGNGTADIAIGHIVMHPTVVHAHETVVKSGTLSYEQVLEERKILENIEYTQPFWSDGIVAIGRASDIKKSTNIWHFVKP